MTYQVKYNGCVYDIEINEGIYEASVGGIDVSKNLYTYDIESGGIILSDEEIYESSQDAIFGAIKNICQDDTLSIKLLMREITIDEVLDETTN